MKIYSNFIPAEQWESKLTPELKSKPITVFNDRPPQGNELSENPINILMIMEPNQLFGLHNWALQNWQQFSCVLTWGQELLDTADNAAFFPFGISWLDKKYVDEVDNRPKKFEVSYLCGGKKTIEGHHLRHRLYQREFEIIIPKKWYYTLPDYDYNGGHHSIRQYEGQPPGSEKKIIWNESMFSICVENSRNLSYQTEKIIDAFLTKTVPIYWGCPNLGEFYDPNGFILCEDENEIIKICNSLTPEDYYSRKEAIDKNYETAKYYGDLFGRFRDTMDEIVKLNEL